MQKIIIDTDPGIDDAMAIMLALRAHKKGKIQIIAITLVNGNSGTENAKINILRVLETFDLEDKVCPIMLWLLRWYMIVLYKNIQYLGNNHK